MEMATAKLGPSWDGDHEECGLTSAWWEGWSTAATEPQEVGSVSARASSMFSWRGRTEKWLKPV